MQGSVFETRWCASGTGRKASLSVTTGLSPLSDGTAAVCEGCRPFATALPLVMIPAMGVSRLQRAMDVEVGLPPGCASALAGDAMSTGNTGSLKVLDRILDGP